MVMNGLTDSRISIFFSKGRARQGANQSVVFRLLFIGRVSARIVRQGTTARRR